LDKLSKDQRVIKEREQLKGDYKATFSTASGKRVLDDLAKRCFVKTTTFREPDLNATIFNEGKRAVYLHLQTMIEEGSKKRRGSKQ